MATKPMRRTVAPMHPGEIAAEVINDLRIGGKQPSMREVARRLRITSTGLAKVLAAKDTPITPDMALRLEALLGLPAETWLRMQMEHDLWRAREKLKGELARIKPVDRK
jgi:addiction module HigA family antidote